MSMNHWQGFIDMKHVSLGLVRSTASRVRRERREREIEKCRHSICLGRDKEIEPWCPVHLIAICTCLSVHIPNNTEDNVGNGQ